jgi:capsular polysaccharide biosynthesis protein
VEPAAPAPPADPPLDLSRVVSAVRRNAWLVVAIVSVVTGVIVAVSLAAPPRYQARARLVADTSTLDAVDSTTVDRGLASSQVLITSPSVLGAAAHQLPGETAESLAANVSAGVDSTAGMVDVIATERDPRRAARTANTVATTFLRSRTVAQQSSAERAAADLRAQLAGLPKKDAAGPLGDALRQRLSDLAVSSVTAGSGMSLAEPATVPSAPYAPRPLRNGVLAAIAGLLLAVMAVVVRERLRGDTPDPRALARAAGRPLLAVLADGRSENGIRKPGIVARWRARHGVTGPAEEQVAVAEAALQGSVKAALPPKSPRAVLVCGVTAGQAHDRVAYGLARALSWAGSSATLLSCWEDGLATDSALEAARRAGHQYVILDMPAVDESLDLQLVSWQLDGAILVAGLGASTAEVAVAAQLLQVLDVHVLGLVVTAPAGEIAAHPIGSFEPAARPPARSRTRRGGSRHRSAASLAPAPTPDDGFVDLPLAASDGATLWQGHPAGADELGGSQQTSG